MSLEDSSDWTTVEVSALKPNTLPGLRGPSPLLRLQSDERLIALTRRGQHAAFETLFSRYNSRLLAFCRHMLGSREDAEDVLQEVFAAAFNAVLADEREINVRPWLYRIARNRSLNHLRRASAIGVDSMDIHFADQGQSTSDKVMRRESFRQLIGDVQQLPETQRTALLLREIDALSYEQIAQAMDTTVPSVKSLLVRARISLAEASEARKLTCDEVRLELGEVAEGLAKTTAPARRHLRDCQRCRAFRKHLKANNHALAAVLPVGPLLIFKKLVLTKLGTTASAGAGHMAGAGGATASAAAGAGAAGAAGAAGGAGATGSLLTAGAGALATKAAATLAAAAIVTAGAAVADHTGHTRVHHRHHPALVAASAASHHAYTASAPLQVTRSIPQPLSAANPRSASSASSIGAAHRKHRRKPVKPSATTTSPVSDPATDPNAPAAATTVGTGVVNSADPKTPVTQVTSESTELPSTTTTPSPATPPVSSTPTSPATTTLPPTPAPATPVTSTAPPTPVSEAPSTSGSTPPVAPAEAPAASTPPGSPTLSP